MKWSWLISKHYAGIAQQEVTKTKDNLSKEVCVSFEFWSEHLRYTNLEIYVLTSVFS
jgi:hypothetical protein